MCHLFEWVANFKRIGKMKSHDWQLANYCLFHFRHSHIHWGNRRPIGRAARRASNAKPRRDVVLSLR